MKSNSEIKRIVPSSILEEMTVEGDVYGEGALEIGGNLRGNVRCLSVSVGLKAYVEGDITAERVEVLGQVVGNITAKKIICGSAAKVSGDILHSSIHIENGAHIDGSCRKFVPEEAEVFEQEIGPVEVIESEESDAVVAEIASQSTLDLESQDTQYDGLVYKKEVS